LCVSWELSCARRAICFESSCLCCVLVGRFRFSLIPNRSAGHAVDTMSLTLLVSVCVGLTSFMCPFDCLSAWLFLRSRVLCALLAQGQGFLC
jgi:hypothetical protein